MDSDRPGDPSGDGGTATGESETDRPGRSPRLTIVRRELASLRSEKTIVLALAIQLFVAMFSSFLVVGLVSLYDPGSTGGFEPTFGLTGNATTELEVVLDDTDGVQMNRYGSPDAAADAFQRGDVDAVLQANYTGDGAVRLRAVAPEESVRTTLIVVRIQRVAERVERNLRERAIATGELDVETLPVPERRPASPYFGFTYTVLVPLLMFLPAFISGSIAVDSLTEEVQRGTLELLRAAPVSLPAILDAKLLAATLLAPVQAVAWLALLWVNGTRVVNWPELTLLVAGVATTVVAAGVAVALLTPDRRQAQFLYSTGVLVVALLASLLPEHPANTVAKLAVGSPTASTRVAVVGYLLLGVGSYLALRLWIGRIDPEQL